MKSFVVLIILCFSLFTLSAGETEQVTIPDFTLENASGEEVSLYETLNDSTVVIIDFWATWCAPCKIELPHLDTLQNKYKNLEVLTITTDSRRTMKKAMAYIKSKGYNFTVLKDPRKKVQKLLDEKSIPVTFIINPDHKIYYRHLGYKEGDEIELENKLVELLMELKLID